MIRNNQKECDKDQRSSQSKGQPNPKSPTYAKVAAKNPNDDRKKKNDNERDDVRHTSNSSMGKAHYDRNFIAHETNSRGFRHNENNRRKQFRSEPGQAQPRFGRNSRYQDRLKGGYHQRRPGFYQRNRQTYHEYQRQNYRPGPDYHDMIRQSYSHGQMNRQPFQPSSGFVYGDRIQISQPQPIIPDMRYNVPVFNSYGILGN